MPEITLENGKIVNISKESYKALAESVNEKIEYLYNGVWKEDESRYMSKNLLEDENMFCKINFCNFDIKYEYDYYAPNTTDYLWIRRIKR